MKIATWNVNGIRARQGQFLDWLAAEKPDVVCLQEIKASLDQLPFELRDVENYWSYWHGEKGYSGVALLVSKTLTGSLPVCSHPGFDFEQRIACATVPSPAGEVMVATVYVPNGGKDFDAKMRFLQALETYVGDVTRDGRLMIMCGDLNVARTERDIHPKELALRVMLELMAANPESPIVNFIRGLTSVLLSPFAGLIGSTTIGGKVLEMSSLFAMGVYALAAVAIERLVWLISYRPRSPAATVTETTTTEHNTTPYPHGSKV